MVLDGSDTVSSGEGPGDIGFDVFGGVLSNNFFLLKLRVPATGNCAVNGVMVLQGIGSLKPITPAGMTFTGSAVERGCGHMVFRVGLTKQ